MRPRWAKPVGPPSKWSQKTWDLFYSLLEQGFSDWEIGTYLRMSTGTAKYARESRGWEVGPALGGYLSLRGVALRMGYAETSSTPRRWVKEGRLRALVRRWECRPKYTTVLVKQEWLLEFLEDPQQFHQWEWERIPDQWLREWARKRRQGAVMTTREAAEVIGVEYGTLRTWMAWYPELPVLRDGIGGRAYWPKDLVRELSERYVYGAGIREMVRG